MCSAIITARHLRFACSSLELSVQSSGTYVCVERITHVQISEHYETSVASEESTSFQAMLTASPKTFALTRFLHLTKRDKCAIPDGKRVDATFHDTNDILTLFAIRKLCARD